MILFHSESSAQLQVAQDWQWKTSWNYGKSRSKSRRMFKSWTLLLSYLLRWMWRAGWQGMHLDHRLWNSDTWGVCIGRFLDLSPWIVWASLLVPGKQKMGCLTNNYCVPDGWEQQRRTTQYSLLPPIPVSGHFSHICLAMIMPILMLRQKNDSAVRVPRQRALVLVLIIVRARQMPIVWFENVRQV
jgi:hypothetical protein